VARSQPTHWPSGFRTKITLQRFRQRAGLPADLGDLGMVRYRKKLSPDLLDFVLEEYSRMQLRTAKEAALKQAAGMIDIGHPRATRHHPTERRPLVLGQRDVVLLHARAWPRKIAVAWNL
jgi:hypothetical protein